MSYTNVPKPILPTYSNSNAMGKEQYDQADLAYDDSSTFYDGINQSQYTNTAKPTLPSYTNIPKPI